MADQQNTNTATRARPTVGVVAGDRVDVRVLGAMLAPVVAAIAAVTVGYLTVTSGSHVDLITFQQAARSILDGLSPYGTGLVPFVYPPAGLALTFIALGGPALWAALSLAALARVVWLCTRAAWPALDPRAAAVRACWAFTALTVLEPTLLCLAFGQVGLLLLWLTIEGTLPGRPARAALLGVAIAIKLTPAFMLLTLAAARRWSSIAYAAAGAIAVTAVVWVVFPAAVAGYLAGGWRAAAEVNTNVDGQNHSLPGLARVLDWPPAVTVALVLVVGAAGVLAGGWWWRHGDPLTAVAVTLVAGLLVSPISWTHHWVAAYPALILLAREHRAPAARLLLAGAAGWLLWVDVLGLAGSLILAPGESWPLLVVAQQEWSLVWGLVLVGWVSVRAWRGRGAGIPAVDAVG